MAYTPLVLPAMPESPDFAAAANFLADSAQALVSSGNSFIEGLSDLKESDYFTIGDLPTFQSVIFYSGSLGEQAFQRPERPNMTPVSIQDLIDRMRSLTTPGAPDLEFDYTDPGYSSALRDPLIAKLLDDLTAGGYGIEAVDEVALFNRARDREVQLAQANVEEIRRQMLNSSFPLPPGVMFKNIMKVQQDATSRISSVNRDIALKRADLFVEQRRRVIDQILQSEAQSIALYNAIQSRGLLIARTHVEMAISLYEAGIRTFEAELEALTKQAMAQLEFSRTSAAVYSADIAEYQAFVNALTAESQAFINNQRNILDRDKARLTASVEQIKFRLAQLSMTIENAKDINKYGSEFFRTALGATMNGINGLAVQTGEVTE